MAPGAGRADADTGPSRDRARDPRDEEARTTQTEGQTARDIFPEDDGIPEVAQDDSPTHASAPRTRSSPRCPASGRPPASTSAPPPLEQAEGEPLDGRLAREVPDDAPDVRPAEDPQRAGAQLEQDLDTTPPTDSGTDAHRRRHRGHRRRAGRRRGPRGGAVHVTDG